MRAAVIGVMLSLSAMHMADAQQTEAVAPMSVLTLDQDRVFSASRFGRQSLEAVDAQARALQAENRRIESDLESEEKSLTERRPGMTPADFQAEAEAFDLKVKDIRLAQETKARDLAAQRDAARQRFMQTAAPVLARIMQERGAVAILDRSAIILSFDRADVTDVAIERIDAVLMEAEAPDAAAGPAPDPAPAPTVPIAPNP